MDFSRDELGKPIFCLGFGHKQEVVGVTLPAYKYLSLMFCNQKLKLIEYYYRYH